ncbi:hypothetical protein H4R26_005648 [Coemansia thaxteri]|uniref:Uncharacterized protein n=1 Tax=Coemansia thaxteri TaxID=2663907 RepID=A0A9W8BDV1_9FUNG|nr:hypothetical protein H4R26_005648 [Coemansia thaxteri]
MSVVRHKEYEREWLLRLRTDGLQDMYETNLNLRAEGPIHYSRMNSSAINQFEKNIIQDSARESRFFDIQGFAPVDGIQGADAEARVCDGFTASKDATTTPHSRGNNGRCYDTRSINSLDTVDDDAKNRRII